ncbi:MAG: hypothetical protein HY907_16350 [Deltaproteobacteria bacterium]|nr:hypothetical protein [Deltaproteobacteria bacterium]
MRGPTLILACLAACLVAGGACTGGDAAADDDSGVDVDVDAEAIEDEVVEDQATDPWPEVPSASRPRVLADGLSRPCGLAAAGDGVYVAEEGEARVLLVPLAGGTFEEAAASLDGPTMLAAAGGDVFVTQRAAGTVVRVRAGAATTLASGERNPGRIRTDGSFVYWVAEGTAELAGAVRRVSVDGGVPSDVVAPIRSPRGLALAGERCYFTDGEPIGVGWVPVDGGDPVRVSDVDGTPFDILVDAAAGEVFWTSPGRRGGGWIHRTDLDLGGDARVGFSPPGPSFLAADDSRVFWSTSQTISWAPRAGGGYQDLVIETSACDLALVDRTLVWTESATGRVLATDVP